MSRHRPRRRCRRRQERVVAGSCSHYIRPVHAPTTHPSKRLRGILAELGILVLPSRKKRRPRAPPAPIPPQTVAPPQGPAFAPHLF
jgi:hypothetical protein